MNSIGRLVALAFGLVLLLNVTPGWGQPFINPTASDANNNTAGGTGALGNVASGPAGGRNNTGFGFNALNQNTTGLGNTATGDLALSSNLTGLGNTATGVTTLPANTTGSDNTATGANALFTNTTGHNNTATGALALLNNDIGNSNSAHGVDVLFSNTSGSSNTATGFQTLNSNSTGSSNTAIGAKALKNSLGTKNIGIGYQAGVSLVNGNNNIYIGNQGAGDEFQTIRIGTAQASTFIAGIVTAGVDGASVQVDGNGQLGIAPSSARYKQDIAPMDPSSERVLQLNPVTFAYKEDARHVKHYGLIAEDVEKVYPELVTPTASGEVQAVKYQELVPMLLNELQRQRQAFQQESAEVAMLRKELADLRALVGQGRETAALAR